MGELLTNHSIFLFNFHVCVMETMTSGRSLKHFEIAEHQMKAKHFYLFAIYYLI